MLHFVFSYGGKAKLGDIPNTFINSEVDAEVFMNKLEGFQTDALKVCQLLQNLYLPVVLGTPGHFLRF